MLRTKVKELAFKKKPDITDRPRDQGHGLEDSNSLC